MKLPSQVEAISLINQKYQNGLTSRVGLTEIFSSNMLHVNPKQEQKNNNSEITKS